MKDRSHYLLVLEGERGEFTWHAIMTFLETAEGCDFERSGLIELNSSCNNLSFIGT